MISHPEKNDLIVRKLFDFGTAAVKVSHRMTPSLSPYH